MPEIYIGLQEAYPTMVKDDRDNYCLFRISEAFLEEILYNHTV